MITPPAMTTPHWVNDLPPQPGVYRFHGAEGELLYIGKSINIRQRVKVIFNHISDPPGHAECAN